VAEKAIAGIRRNRRIVLVTPLAYALYYATRLAPEWIDLAQRLYGWQRRRKFKPPQMANPELAPTPTLRVGWFPDADESSTQSPLSQGAAPPPSMTSITQRKAA
jgi:hypothetical protein